MTGTADGVAGVAVTGAGTAMCALAAFGATLARCRCAAPRLEAATTLRIAEAPTVTGCGCSRTTTGSLASRDAGCALAYVGAGVG